MISLFESLTGMNDTQSIIMHRQNLYKLLSLCFSCRLRIMQSSKYSLESSVRKTGSCYIYEDFLVTDGKQSHENISFHAFCFKTFFR